MLGAFVATGALAAATARARTLVATTAGQEPVAYVNPFNGSQGGAPDFGDGGGAGATYPGAVAPFGMLQWSPDTIPSTDNFAGGYSYKDNRIRGFSLTHMSGAGCANYQDFPFLPTTQPIGASPQTFGSSDLASQFQPSFSHGKRAPRRVTTPSRSTPAHPGRSEFS